MVGSGFGRGYGVGGVDENQNGEGGGCIRPYRAEGPSRDVGILKFDLLSKGRGSC
jgi:hypothetical protein